MSNTIARGKKEKKEKIKKGKKRKKKPLRNAIRKFDFGLVFYTLTYKTVTGNAHLLPMGMSTYIMHAYYAHLKALQSTQELLSGSLLHSAPFNSFSLLL